MLNRLYGWYGKGVVWTGGVVVFVLLISGTIFSLTGSTSPEVTDKQLRTVDILRVSNITGGATINLVGTVEAVSEVNLQSEASGRITRTYVSLGETVKAGQRIATIENASEYASLLQAEGSYEVALANAVRTGLSAESVYTSALSNYRSAFVTIQDVMQNTVSSFFTPQNQSSFDLTDYSWERRLINYDLNDWKELTATLSADSGLITNIAEAELLTQRVSDLTDVIFQNLISKEKTTDDGTLQTQIEVYKSSLSAARTKIGNAQSTLRNARTSITNADSELAGSGNTISSADGGIKQALGVLRSAQANYAKTIITTPIAGTVNAISIKSGDYVGNLSPIAVVANNNALEITAFISESERNRVAVGSNVIIEEKFEGTVSNISPAINPSTKKVEIKIQTTATELSNGDTVRLSISSESDQEVPADTATDIIVPITALKVETDRIVIFTVSSEGILEAHTVSEGPLLGSSIIINSGVTSDMEIVIDARGLNEGDQVLVAE